ncbi:MAG: formylglycine-generating enzyme family protein, partial [Candidatus Brocadiae bacterium]|nr:formylglycine-generating enzyme family protein [Candidatus Brocadiia bacterium]
GKYEVTQAQWKAVMGTTLHQQHDKAIIPWNLKGEGPEHPVYYVSWAEVVEFCKKLGKKFRLPTEAEWEYACRAGTKTGYSFGHDPGKLRDYGWFKDNSHDETHPVGRKRPNPWGLYDLHGNVAEWCNDLYSEDYYVASVGENPTGPPSGDERVLRGGNWRSSGDVCRSSARYSETPGFADVCFGYEAYGFRCVRRAPNDASQ